MVAEWRACPTRYERFERVPLSLVRPLVDNDLALAVSLFDLARKFAKQRPLQVRQRRAIEMTFNDSADVSKQTISVCRGLVELTAATHRTIAVVVGMALEFLIVRHVFGPPSLMSVIGVSPQPIDATQALNLSAGGG